MSPTRTEMFTDAVLAIAATLLVLDLIGTPARGEFLATVLEEWPAYLAYLAAFLTIATLWLAHHSMFATIRTVTPVFLLWNLVLLLGIALVPWPVSLLAAAIRDGDRVDGVVASAVYTAVSLLITAGMVGMNRMLLRRPQLLTDESARPSVQRRLTGSWLTAIPIVLAVGLAAISPLLALLVYVGRPVFFLVALLREAAAAEAAEVAASAAAEPPAVD